VYKLTRLVYTLTIVKRKCWKYCSYNFSLMLCIRRG